jgi:hypothetical protein
VGVGVVGLVPFETSVRHTHSGRHRDASAALKEGVGAPYPDEVAQGYGLLRGCRSFTCVPCSAGVSQVQLRATATD